MRNVAIMVLAVVAMAGWTVGLVAEVGGAEPERPMAGAPPAPFTVGAGGQGNPVESGVPSKEKATPGHQANGRAGARPRFAIADYPRTDGSTSAQPLGMLVACRLTGTTFWWQRGLDGIQRLVPVERGRSTLRNAPPASATLPEGWEIVAALATRTEHHGTHQSYEAVIKGECDLAYICRLPSEDELALAAEREVELDPVPIALDAFVFIVNEANWTPGLTSEQVRRIYTGGVHHWSDFGGPDWQVQAFQRDRNSGSQETMERLVMRDGKMTESAPRMMLAGMAGPINMVGGRREGLGYTFYYFQRRMTADLQLRILAIDGIMPGEASIAMRKYPFTTEVYAVVRKDLPEDHSARRIRRWLLTDEGQKLVAESGYVPLKHSP